MITVSSFGRLPNDILLCGEMFGETEYLQDRPFVGKSGQLQKWHLSRYNINPDSFYLTNVCKEYIKGNPDPTPEQIEFWTPILLSEVHECNPRLIIAVGKYAVQWFLGESATLELTHGLPHYAGAFDSSRSNRAPANCIILPIYHPASTFYGDEKKKTKQKILLSLDYKAVSEAVTQIRRGLRIEVLTDEYKGREVYLDVTGKQLSDYIYCDFDFESNIIALDTEGIPSDPWSIQVSWQPGTAFTLRYSQPDFYTGVQALQSLADKYRTTFYLHCANTPSG